MTDELIAEIAQDYMNQMGLTNTPFIVVRHYDKGHLRNQFRKSPLCLRLQIPQNQSHNLSRLSYLH
ncbi:MAG: relaxase/mobilization nuclease domain-containing protein, partial [Muribaculaceae bacterium]|nr:relaxase/mobilization nuclease domain-containing protein [Muribaculaceae bacterium]